MTVAIVVEGVLRKIGGGGSIPQGIDLYYGLATRSKIVLLTEDTITDVAHWTTAEGMHEHQKVIATDVVGKSKTLALAREASLVTASNSGFAFIDLVIEPDPEVAAYLITRGFSVMLFCHAQYAVPSWRPDYKEVPRPWDDLSASIAYEAELRANDKRKNET